MLTRQQSRLLQFLRKNGQDQPCPTFEDIKAYLGLKSKSGVSRLVLGLEERGFIERLPYRRRALRVLAVPKPIEARQPTLEVTELMQMPTTVLARELRARGFVVARPL